MYQTIKITRHLGNVLGHILSIILINFNTKNLLKNCIDSIYEKTLNVDSEIIVVDNNSTDGSIEMVKNYFPDVTLILNQTNLGFAAANNQGMKIANGKFILLLNSDTYFIDNSLEKAMDYMSKNVDIDILGIKLINKDLSLQPSCFQFPSLWNLFVEATFLYKVFPKTRLFGSYYMTWFNYDSPMDVDYMTGAFLLIRRSVIETIGFLDEDYFMYTEEVDFCFRAKKRNMRIAFYQNASVVHLGGGSVTQRYVRFYQLHSAQFLFFKKNYAIGHAMLLMVVKWLGVVIRVCTYAIIGFVTFNPDMLKKSFYYFRIALSVYILRK